MKKLLGMYTSELIHALHSIDANELEKAINILIQAYQEDRQIFVAGNGGSAGTANHFVCDFGKNAIRWERRRFRIHSLCDNPEVITALGNDIAFDQIFRFQMENVMRRGDVVMLISASGNSPDLLKACEYAKQAGGKLIAFSGFGGGKICDNADAKIVTDMRSYERIEDLHLIICHMIVSYFKENSESILYGQ